MNLNIIMTLLFFICHLDCFAQVKSPGNIIFDTDMGPDYDDVGALAMLHAMADKGEANILGTIACTNYEGVASVLDVINTHFNRPSIPIGVAGDYGLDKGDWQHWSDSLISNYPHTIRKNTAVPMAVDLYRKLLSEQPDESVTIVTVGFLSNIAALMQSKADQNSPLNGRELINKKVKLMVSMAGKFPEGMEFNIEEDAAAGIFVFQNWEKPLILSGFEIGQKVKTGIPLIQNEAIQNNPIKDVYRISIPMAEEDKSGRMSWDQTAVLVAVRGATPYYELVKGKITLNQDGYNQWADEGEQFHLKEKMTPSEVEKIINDLMMHQPIH